MRRNQSSHNRQSDALFKTTPIVDRLLGKPHYSAYFILGHITPESTPEKWPHKTFCRLTSLVARDGITKILFLKLGQLARVQSLAFARDCHSLFSDRLRGCEIFFK